MATSGDGRSRGGVGGLAAAAALLCMAVSGYSATEHGAAAADRQIFNHWCEARANGAWHDVIAGNVLPLSRRLSLKPLALAHDGRSFFVEIHKRGGWSGVGRIDVPSGRVRHIHRFKRPRTDQAGGAFDGRWLVWSETHRLEDPYDVFTMLTWDSRTGAVTKIGEAKRGRDGQFYPSPWRDPDVRAGIAAWAQGSAPGGLTQVHAYDLARGRDRVARTGHPGGAFLVNGPLVVWPESPAPGAWTRMRAFDPAHGREVTPPSALRPLRGISGLRTDGRALAFPGAKYKSLSWTPSLSTSARLVLRTYALRPVGNSVQVSGRHVAFDIQPRTFLADAKLGRYVQLRGGGLTLLDRRSLVVVHPTGSKEWGVPAPITFVPLQKLPPMPRCS